MLKVTIELFPFGDASKAETIGTLFIANTRIVNKKEEHKYKFNTVYKNMEGEESKKSGEVWHSRKNTVMLLLSSVFKRLEKEIIKDGIKIFRSWKCF